MNQWIQNKNFYFSVDNLKANTNHKARIGLFCIAQDTTRPYLIETLQWWEDKDHFTFYSSKFKSQLEGNNNRRQSWQMFWLLLLFTIIMQMNLDLMTPQSPV